MSAVVAEVTERKNASRTSSTALALEGAARAAEDANLSDRLSATTQRIDSDTQAIRDRVEVVN